MNRINNFFEAHHTVTDRGVWLRNPNNTDELYDAVTCLIMNNPLLNKKLSPRYITDAVELVIGQVQWCDKILSLGDDDIGSADECLDYDFLELWSAQLTTNRPTVAV